ncbi:MAG: PAS domain S-box protein, partial [Planctomycetota bacterium]
MEDVRKTGVPGDERSASPWRPEDVLESCALAIFGIAKDGRIFLWNPAAHRLFGYAPREALGRPAFDLLAASLDTDPQQIMSRFHRGEPLPYVEGSLRCKDGRTFDAALLLSTIRDASGRPVGLCAVSQDLGPIRRLEARLRRNLDLMTRAEKVAGLGSWGWDVDRNIVYWSEMLYEIFGLRPETFEATFEAFLARVHPEDVPRVQQAVQTAVRQQKAFDFFHRVIRPEGTILRVRCRGQFLAGPSAGRYLVGICQDVTGEKDEQERFRRALEEEAARRAEREKRALVLAKASLILAQAPDVRSNLGTVASLLAEHAASVCLMDVRDAQGNLERAAAASRDPSRSKEAPELLRTSLPARAVRTRKTVLLPSVREEDLIRAGVPPAEVERLRELRPLSMIVTPLRVQNRVAGALTLLAAESEYGAEDVRFAEDLAYRIGLALENEGLLRETREEARRLREAEDRLRALNAELERKAEERTEELRATMAELEAFAYSVAHDLRAPLRAMRGFGQVLLEEHASKLEAEARDYLARIAAASAQL